MRRRLLLTLIVCAAALPAGAAAPSVEQFIARHWRVRSRPRGPRPRGSPPSRRHSRPRRAATCHPAQLADWRTSLHARADGPRRRGTARGDVHERARRSARAATRATRRSRSSGRSCSRCRPRAESRIRCALRAQGLVCAACHVRAHERFGPPRRDGSLANSAPRETLPHGGVTRTPAFLASEFCRGCHQFTSNGFALNGKLLENTHEEWKASRFAREGVQCQDCHMPERRHLWRGIHDPEMVRSGVTITARRRCGQRAARDGSVGGDADDDEHARRTRVSDVRHPARGPAWGARRRARRDARRHAWSSAWWHARSRSISPARSATRAAAGPSRRAALSQARGRLRRAAEVHRGGGARCVLHDVLRDAARAGRRPGQGADPAGARGHRRSPFTIFEESFALR